MYRMSVTQKGQLVIPKELRDRHGIKPNSEVIVTEIGGNIAILPAMDPIRQGRGMLRFDQSTAELLKESRSTEIKKDSRRAPVASRKPGNVSKQPRKS
jgi:AbrB family looped-hinge helix DNA binding protein